MSDNTMRTSLVTQLHCTDCKGVLYVSYAPKDGNPNRGMGYTDDEITGAAKVQHRLFVEPCRKCIGDARKPLEALRVALAAIGPSA